MESVDPYILVFLSIETASAVNLTIATATACDCMDVVFAGSNGCGLSCIISHMVHYEVIRHLYPIRQFCFDFVTFSPSNGPRTTVTNTSLVVRTTELMLIVNTLHYGKIGQAIRVYGTLWLAHFNPDLSNEIVLA